MYLVNIHFFDSYQLNLEVEDELLDQFLGDLGQSKIFFTKNKASGFWLKGEQIRYFMLKKLGEPPSCLNQNLEAENALKL